MRQETRLLRQFIRDAATAGKSVTYQELEKHVGWRPGSSQNKNRGVLYCAFRWLEKEHGFYAVNTPKVGYSFTRGSVALDASELQRTQKIRSQVDKMLNTYENCKADASPEERSIHRNKIAFLEFAVSEPTQKEIELATAMNESRQFNWGENMKKATQLLMEQ